MGSYINVLTGEHPVSFSQVKKCLPNVSFSKKPVEVGEYRRVQQTTRPEFNPDVQHVAEGNPVLCRGGYVQTWVVTDYAEDLVLKRQTNLAAYAEKKVRRERKLLLEQTDWTANSDVHMSVEMATYRQALRDITSQESFPWDISWPELEGVN